MRGKGARSLLGVSPMGANLSTSRPELSPTPTTLGADSLVGIAITYCFLLCLAQSGLAVVGAAYDKGDERRRELDHHVPRQDHDVGATAVSSTGFKQRAARSLPPSYD